jgi:hypothetical protein
MDKAPRPYNSQCYKLLSEPFRIYLCKVGFIADEYSWKSELLYKCWWKSFSSCITWQTNAVKGFILSEFQNLVRKVWQRISLSLGLYLHRKTQIREQKSADIHSYPKWNWNPLSQYSSSSKHYTPQAEWLTFCQYLLHRIFRKSVDSSAYPCCLGILSGRWLFITVCLTHLINILSVVRLNPFINGP